MTQPVQLVDVPQFHPHICIRCKGGTGSPGRIYFVSLGISMTQEFNPLHEGEIYYCNICVANLVVDINNVISKYNEAHAPWDSPDRVASTYQWEKEIDLSGIERTLSGDSDRSLEGLSGVTEGDDSPVESNDSTSEGTVDVPDSTVPTTSSDDFQRTSIDVRDGLRLDFS